MVSEMSIHHWFVSSTRKHGAKWVFNVSTHDSGNLHPRLRPPLGFQGSTSSTSRTMSSDKNVSPSTSRSTTTPRSRNSSSSSWVVGPLVPPPGPLGPDVHLVLLVRPVGATGSLQNWWSISCRCWC